MESNNDKKKAHLSTAINIASGIPDDVTKYYGNDVAQTEIDVVLKLGKAAADWLTDPNTIDMINMGFSMLGTAAAVCPFLLPVQIALKDIGSAMKGALYNREVARALYSRCAESATVVAKLHGRIMQMATDEVFLLSLSLLYSR